MRTRYHLGLGGNFYFYFFGLLLFLPGWLNKLTALSFQSFSFYWTLMYSFPLSFFCWWHRYKKLLCTVDLTKDFFFSYSYHVMLSFQKNMYNHEAGQLIYETMFVWNEFMTRGIRYHLKSTLWTVALVYGFFKQVLNSWALSYFIILKLRIKLLLLWFCPFCLAA